MDTVWEQTGCYKGVIEAIIYAGNKKKNNIKDNEFLWWTFQQTEHH